jgi:hypothetical protein
VKCGVLFEVRSGYVNITVFRKLWLQRAKSERTSILARREACVIELLPMNATSDQKATRCSQYGSCSAGGEWLALLRIHYVPGLNLRPEHWISEVSLAFSRCIHASQVTTASFHILCYYPCRRPRGPGFAPRAVHVGFLVDRMAVGQVYLRVLWLLPRQYHSTAILYLLMYHCMMVNGPVSCRSSMQTQSRPIATMTTITVDRPMILDTIQCEGP